MPIIECYVDQDTLDRLSSAADDLDSSVELLAEALIAEAALNYARK